MKLEKTNPDLIAALENGDDHEAWREFESWYAPIIRSFCISRGMCQSDTDDVAQEVFLRISQSRIATQYDPSLGRFRSYLFQVTRSVVSSNTRRRVPAKSLESQEALSSIVKWNKAWNEDSARRAIIHVERTSSSHSKQILSLSIRGASPAVIVETLGVSIHSVYKTRQRLRTSIEEFIQLDQNEGLD